MKTDSELLREFFVEKSERAFRTLVDRHLNWVYSVTLRQVGGDGHLAEDVCQEVFASLARKAGTLLEFAALEGWLFKAARFAASDLVRAERRRRERELEAGRMDEMEEAGFADLDWESAGELLDEAILQLREDERDAVCMRFFEGRRFAEIGERLGVAENTARMRVTRAVEKLQGILAGRGVKSSAAAMGAVMGAHRLVSAPAGLAAGIAGVSLLSTTTTSIGIMATGKVLMSMAAAVSLVGVGVALYKNQEAGQLREELAAADARALELGGRIEVLEGKLEVASVEKAGLKSGGETVAVLANKPVEPLTSAGVRERFDAAKALAKRGERERALEEFLWLLDVGMLEVKSFAGVRTSYLLDEIVGLFESLPAARAALVERRAALEAQMQSLLEEGDAVDLDLALWSRINGTFGEEDRSLLWFDRVENENLKRKLSIYLKRELVAAKRYSDVLRLGAIHDARRLFEMNARREPPASLDSEKAEAFRVRNRTFAIQSMTETIEILAGAGELGDAADLAADLLAFDASEATIDGLRSQLERAGGLGVLDALLAEYGAGGTSVEEGELR